MGINLKYYYNGYYPYFTLENNVTNDEFKDLLVILQELIDKKDKFIFLLDARNVTSFNFLYCGIETIKWMRTNKSSIKDILQGSSIVLSNKTTVNFMNWVFDRQKPITPNKVTTNIDEGVEFLENIAKLNFVKKNISTRN